VCRRALKAKDWFVPPHPVNPCKLRFVVDKGAMEQFLLRMLWSSPFSIILPTLDTSFSSIHRRHDVIKATDSVDIKSILSSTNCLLVLEQRPTVDKGLLIIEVSRSNSDTRVIRPTPRPIHDSSGQSQETRARSPGGIRTYSPRKRADAEPRLWTARLLGLTVTTQMNYYPAQPITWSSSQFINSACFIKHQESLTQDVYANRCRLLSQARDIHRYP